MLVTANFENEGVHEGFRKFEAIINVAGIEMAYGHVVVGLVLIDLGRSLVFIDLGRSLGLFLGIGHFRNGKIRVGFFGVGMSVFVYGMGVMKNKLEAVVIFVVRRLRR